MQEKLTTAASASRCPTRGLFIAVMWLLGGLTTLGTGAGEVYAQVASYGFNEGTGSSTADLSGNGRTGSLTSTTWSTLGRVGNALTFNGSSARVNVADAAPLDLTTGMTLEAWVFPTSLSGTRTVIYKERSGGFAYALFASDGAATPRPVASIRIGTTNFSATGASVTLPLNAWSHLAATYNGSSLILYVNGIQAATTAVTGSIVATGNALRIGGNTQVAGQYFAGRIDEVRIFNQARSAAQITTDMNTPVDTAPPTITARVPASGAIEVSSTAAITATFSESMAATTINTNTFQLRDASGTLVSASVTYAANTRIATLTPAAALANGTTYTATIAGGTGGVTDVSGNAMASSSSWSFTTRPGTTATVASSVNPSVFGQGVTFTATVAPIPPATGTPTGTVQFRNGTTNLGSPVSLVGGVATSAPTTTLAVGNRSITAIYSGSAAFAGSTSPALTQVVNRANTATAVTSTPNPSAPGQAVTFTATVTTVVPGSGTPAGSVRFFNGATALATVALIGNTATFTTTTPLNAGSHSITAQYLGNTSFNASTSPVLTQTVRASTTTAVLSSPNPSDPGQTVALTASVAPVAPATGTPTGTVQFQIDGTNFGAPVALVGGSASLGAAGLAEGYHAIAATYGGDVNFAGSSSSTLLQAVGEPTCSGNPIVIENCFPGNPSSEWDISGAGDPTIQGFATEISVNRGQTVFFKIDAAANYKLDIYRMGYYAGMGARRVATISPVTAQTQPTCLTDTSTGLIDCGNWAVSVSWAVPASATSGIYFAKATRLDDNTRASHIVFIVRDDFNSADLLFQTSDTTWQAYNSWGGNSLYTGSPAGRAYKVSYNRPFNTRAVDNGQDWVFNSEYPMVRWLEANGYHVSYFTGVDTERRGSLILNPRKKVFLSVGHDEYWSWGQRTTIETARDAGVHLAFFSGNEIFWKTRWENSIDGTNTPYRTLVTYKETHANAVIDPADPPIWTGTWRDPRFSPPGDGGRPENALSGTLFMANDVGTPFAITVPEADGKMRFWRNTSAATLAPGQTATLPIGTLGYEWDSDVDNGFRPPGLIRMSSTSVSLAGVLQDYGSTYGSGTLTHSLTLYKHSSGALVFGAGTIQWSWGLDANHDRGNTPPDVRMQQSTVNLFADMGVQPGTLQSGLIPATASTDASAPISTITTPAAGAIVPGNTIAIISGTASDTGGGVVGGVEVSVDGGVTWRRATGRANWTYTWNTAGFVGTAIIKSRAADDSGNIETPSAGVTVTVGGSATCPCSIWPAAATPPVPQLSDGAGIEVGVKFRSSVNGFITAIRFYKAAANVGPHVAHLWTSGGGLLATAQFTSETPEGWQEATLPAPVPVSANTIYVASYHTASGHYPDDQNYFATSVSSGPLTFPASSEVGGNGVYAYGAPGFPTNTYNATNYWVDLVFATSGPPDTAAPSVSAVSPAAGAVGVRVRSGMAVTATFNEEMDPGTITSATFLLRDASGNSVPATVTYSQSTLRATLVPASPLAFSSTYTASLKGGLTDPRVKDRAGNALASDFTWSFSTGAPPPPPPTQGPGGPILVVTAGSNPFTVYYAEILRAEGLNYFALADISTISATTLAAYDVVILGQMPLTSAQVGMFTTWVNGGGRLIAMRPDKQLAGLLGLTDAGSTLSEGYLLMDTSTGPASGLVNETIQYHGTADLYTLNGATSVATLYSNASTTTTRPAVVRRAVGTNGGQVAAFTYDLARSVVFTRQGNPAWSEQERDGISPIRSDDLFFGAAAGDNQPDWIDLNKVAIPQADEQQRLLANLILSMNQDRRLLPRFWYLPRGLAAAVVMTGDDHATGGTARRFDGFIASSPAGCVVDSWECVRGTSYVYPGTPVTNSQAEAYTALGFEVALHVYTGCANFTASSLPATYASELIAWQTQYQTLAPPVTNRTHCIVWSDYTTQAQVSFDNGIRFDTNYYYYPGSWVNNRPGFFTGSGMPMRFATAAGEMIDVYQAATQLTDESGQELAFTIDALLAKALGPEGYYGVFTANMHTDTGNPVADNGSSAIVTAAKARGVAVVSARQMLEWLDGRNNSKFSGISWNGTTLSFTITIATGANGLQAMVPIPQGMQVASVTANGSPVPHAAGTVKGVLYAFVMATPATYQVSFTADTTPPTVVSTSPGDGAAGVNSGTTVSAVFSELIEPTTVGPTTFELRDASNNLVPALVSYTSATKTATLTPNSPLAASTTYAAIIKSGVKDFAGNAMSSDVSWSFTTWAAPPPVSLWSAASAPANLDSNDSNAVELGVKFRTDIGGSITAIRFYKGPSDNGSHRVSLWSNDGTLLSSVNVSGETESGWQHVTLPTPIAITANTIYVASYHTTAGRYPFSGAYFGSSGADSGVLHAPSSPSVGGNGVYVYGSGGFPTNTYNATNYWVDVVFQP